MQLLIFRSLCAYKKGEAIARTDFCVVPATFRKWASVTGRDDADRGEVPRRSDHYRIARFRSLLRPIPGEAGSWHVNCCPNTTTVGYGCNLDFFGFSSSVLIWLALGLSGPAFLSAFRTGSLNWESAAETTVGAAVFVGALGLYLSAGSVLAAAVVSLAALAIAPMFRVKSRRLSMLAVSILCLGMYL